MNSNPSRIIHDLERADFQSVRDRVVSRDGAGAENRSELGRQKLTLRLGRGQPEIPGLRRRIRRGTYQLGAQGSNHVDEDALPGD
jgi:hypothetical protein